MCGKLLQRISSYDEKHVTVNGAQIRAARALLDWSAQKLAEASRVSLATIHRAETTRGPLRMTAANLAAIRQTLEEGGVEFLAAENGSGPGVRLRVPDESSESD